MLAVEVKEKTHTHTQTFDASKFPFVLLILSASNFLLLTENGIKTVNTKFAHV